MRALSTQATGRWLIGGMLVLSAGLASTLYLLGDDAAADDGGQIEIMAPPEPLPQPLPGVSSTVSMAQVPVVPTHANLAVADKAAATLIDEKRDSDWAPRSEVAIQTFARTIPYIGNSHYLKVSCRESMCEVNGTVDADPVTGNMKPVWEKLERDTAGPELLAHGLERTAAIFDTGRNGDEFKLYYRRVAPPVAP